MYEKNQMIKSSNILFLVFSITVKYEQSMNAKELLCEKTKKEKKIVIIHKKL